MLRLLVKLRFLVPLAFNFSLLAAISSAGRISYSAVTDEDLGTIPGSVAADVALRGQARRVPPLVSAAQLHSAALASESVPLPEADTLAQVYFQRRFLGRWQRDDGRVVHFVPQVILVKFRGAPRVAAIRVGELMELDALEVLRSRSDVEFAELDVLQQRQFMPDDPQLSQQWHHATIGSLDAWRLGLGEAAIRIAIVDSPFQMDHPDLASNTVPGWSVVTNAVITSSAGDLHATASAGMAAAVVNNGVGGAGAGNCTLLPIHINGFTEEIYDAILWAANHGVRVVSVSWTGADSAALNDAAGELESRTRGLLFMAGVNGLGFLDYPDHPRIYCVSMTDEADNLRSRFGNHIDFAAPGFQVLTTVTGPGFAIQSGTSFSTPLVAGVAGVLFGINSTLGPVEVIDLLKSTTADLGPAGRDQYFGWGRIHFGRAAAAASATRPRLLGLTLTNGQVAVSASFRAGVDHQLEKVSSLASAPWSPVPGAARETNGSVLTFTDPSPAGGAAYYRVVATVSTNAP